jgi:VIT1/CCC1 family predicted Fe2+/Mn2+ transporter
MTIPLPNARRDQSVATDQPAVRGAKASAQSWWETLFPFLAARKAQIRSFEESEQQMLLQVVQPALVGLMDGSVSTLAPLFATAYATRQPHTAFLIGLAAALGAAISMGFAEGLSDDGLLTGRGHPVQRGIITGAATFLGGVLHTLPFLISRLDVALIVAYVIVAIELVAIAAIRFRYFRIPFSRSTIQVIVGGSLVFAAGVLIGSS